MVPEGLEGLDTHVLDATVRARLSPEAFSAALGCHLSRSGWPGRSHAGGRWAF